MAALKVSRRVGSTAVVWVATRAEWKAEHSAESTVAWRACASAARRVVLRVAYLAASKDGLSAAKWAVYSAGLTAAWREHDLAAQRVAS